MQCTYTSLLPPHVGAAGKVRQEHCCKPSFYLVASTLYLWKVQPSFRSVMQVQESESGPAHRDKMTSIT